MYPAIALIGFMAFLAGWQTVESLKTALPPQAKPVAHWTGPDQAFLAASVEGKRVFSVVRLNGGKTEIRFDGAVHADSGGRSITSLDLDGVISGRTVVLFHTEPRLAASAISFDTGKLDQPILDFVLTGIAPGMWEVWRDGWVVDIGVPVRAGEAVLSFAGRPGSYFIRRLQ